ncbi:MAG: NADH-quinone oxidoreductase subunit C [Candidatus Omnitrophica bacterium]|nr:NADH-quinone oxidoreductase subunit C [Candidatus Omnitrophota bacterium]HOX54531.1 NADH-quinone oxidoreductase subunit C [Candidatus Omnitrophota bacterium]
MTDTIKEIKKSLGKKILNTQEHSEKRIYFDIDKKDIVEVAKFLFKEMGLRFSTATGVDTPRGLEILYHFADDKEGRLINIRVLLEDKKKPEIDSIAKFMKAAEWIEREIWELLGVNFLGHPDLRHLLLIDDWPKDDFPLRHDHEHDHEHNKKEEHK